jgi:hypothetical protein
LENFRLRFFQYAEEIYTYLATIKHDDLAQVSLPADIHTYLSGPTLLIGGHPQDTTQYDYVTIGDENFPSTASAWSCWGICIPLPDESLGTVVVSDIWKKLHWSPSDLPSMLLLDSLIAEIQRTARNALFLHSPSVLPEQTDTLLAALEQVCHKRDLAFQILTLA